MPSLTFYHPNITASGSRPGPYLSIPTGFDEISWSYRLNTAVYPTYGGEVVQILSTYIDNLSITGTLPSYAWMERVYMYFAYYLQIATQGRGNSESPGKSSYNLVPIKMTYPERNWHFNIMLTAAPGFRYGRDITAPQWQITAHILDEEGDLDDIKEFTKAQALDRFLANDGEDFDLEGKIGFRAENPFSAPGTVFGDDFDPEKTREEWTKTTDRYNEVIEAYLHSDFDALYGTQASRPSSTSEIIAGKDAEDAQAVARARQRIDDTTNGG
jgi:hypothetical protein